MLRLSELKLPLDHGEEARITGCGLEAQGLPTSSLIKGLADRDSLLLLGIQPTHGIQAPVIGER